MILPDVVNQLFSPLPDIVYCAKDLERVYVAANPAFATRLGVKSTDSIIGRRAEELFEPHLAEVYQKQDESVLTAGESITDRLELITNRDGSLGWYLASKFAVRDEAGEICGLVGVSRDLLTPSAGDLRMARLQVVIEWLHQHLAEQIQTREVAAMAGMTIVQLERTMKRVFKLGTMAFLRKIRIEKAAHLLRESSIDIVEVAHRCGYSEQSSLTRQFKSAVGMPPGEYRRRYHLRIR